MLLTIYSSKRDTYGNTYYAFQLTHLGKILANGVIDGDNFRKHHLHINGIEYVYQELPVREFKQLTKNWKYCGCNWEDIRQHIM
ncbi:MAG: hypothetical protein KDC67_05185 [Ignavibacteriae bacterium]|nr:hypothetical protein [Ignavibacteriota bacterium]